MSSDAHPSEARGPLMDERIRANTIGDLKPQSDQIRIEDYDPRWPELFKREADRTDNTDAPSEVASGPVSTRSSFPPHLVRY
jgi:hypothetical protein